MWVFLPFHNAFCSPFLLTCVRLGSLDIFLPPTPPPFPACAKNPRCCFIGYGFYIFYSQPLIFLDLQIQKKKKNSYISRLDMHTPELNTPAWKHEVFILSVFLAVCTQSYRDFINKCTGTLNTLMFYFAPSREHSHRLRRTLFLRLCPGGPLRYFFGEPGGWRRLHSRVVQSPRLPEQCFWGLDPCPSTVPGKGTAVGTSIHAGRWSHKQLLYNVRVQGSLLETDKTRHRRIRFHYVRPWWYCSQTRFCHSWRLVSKLVCCVVPHSWKEKKTVCFHDEFVKTFFFLLFDTRPYNSVCIGLVEFFQWSSHIREMFKILNSFFLFSFYFTQTGRNASLPKLLRWSVLYPLHRNFPLITRFRGWRCGYVFKWGGGFHFPLFLMVRADSALSRA